MKSGIVALIGRPNVGKSTLINAIIGHKVTITSPKPQTTRYAIQAVYDDDRGQIIFVDTPGIFARALDPVSKKVTPKAEEVLRGRIDCVLYIIDHTRHRDFEENKTLGIVRKLSVPKILVINKIDVKKPTYIEQYVFMEDEFQQTVQVSALKRLNLNILLKTIFSFLPEGEPLVKDELPQPGLNIDSRMFISEIIREKAFLFLRREIPYTLTVAVDEYTERDNGTLYIKARILTSNERYQGMIVGKDGTMIREIGMATRKELETATNKKVFVDLSVVTDPHWVDYM